MTKIKEHRIAILLRKQGKSYSQIKKEVRISKSTLSSWLKSYPLTRLQLRKLRDLNEVRIEKFRITMRGKRENRLRNYYNEEKRKWVPLTHNELFLAGLFLYWGEGNKRMNGPVSINNTDPNVMKFTLYWILYSLKVPKTKIHIHLHLYNDMDIQTEMNYWSQELKIPLIQFFKPYIKKTSKNLLDQKGFGHGTCGLIINDVRLKEKIMMAIRAIADYYSREI